MILHGRTEQEWKKILENWIGNIDGFCDEYNFSRSTYYRDLHHLATHQDETTRLSKLTNTILTFCEKKLEPSEDGLFGSNVSLSDILLVAKILKTISKPTRFSDNFGDGDSIEKDVQGL